MEQVIIRAIRHVHMSPTDADYYGVKPGDWMKLKIGGDCGITLDRLRGEVEEMEEKKNRLVFPAHRFPECPACLEVSSYCARYRPGDVVLVS